ncbi:hydroxymethylglutaryl-CoA synthase [Streptococcus tangpeifui]|uniref:hydroxymethylglutaryl-CoA synthase n=1 Tax=Streptococcus tangpeifui TaxID=2709400 RepID=UPI0013EC4DCA|nr:hydroxymethylglutaryl-CoA synthase [Streptococcus sp. ZJ373]
MSIGIDKIGFATAKYQLKMADLAAARDTDPNKYSVGLMLDSLSIAPITEDIVTLGAAAADQILTEEDKATIDMIIVATESSIDQSKAAAVFIHGLLGIQPFARSLEMKEACYSATAALNYAKLHVTTKPHSKVLVIASDIAKYGLRTSGEPTQGAGALAMLVTSQPRILALNDDNVAQTRDVMDFWRPNYSNTPFVQGMFSTKQYLDCLKTTWAEYQQRYETSLEDFAAFCFHIPYPKLANKGLNKLLDKSVPDEKREQIQQNFEASINYSRQIGNIYTGSLYLSFLSLLENTKTLKAGDKIGFFSYGSGAVSEIFSGQLVTGFESKLEKGRQAQLEQRQTLSVADYEKIFFEEAQLDDQGNAEFNSYDTHSFTLDRIDQHQRLYKRNEIL